MKRYILPIAILSTMLLSSCEGWLNAPQPNTTELGDYYVAGEAAIQNVTAAYVPLMWEFNSTYCAEWFIGDIASDDALKGGQNTNDMSGAYDFENWKTISSNMILDDIYKLNYQGVGRANLVLKYVPDMELDSVLTQSVKDRVIGEAKFLRAFYYFRLVRIFGGVPLIDFVITGSEDWEKPRNTAAEVYQFIIKDLEEAQAVLWKKSEYAPEDLGRATKGAAQAMLQRVNLYLAGDGNEANRGEKSQTDYYTAAKAWGDSIITSSEYNLNPVYADNFTLAGENGIESVFEIQYSEDPTSDFGNGFGFTRGTFTVILTRSRSTVLGGGWGFNKPTQNLYDEFEAGDIRREATILTPTDAEMTNSKEETYLGSRHVNRKYGLYNADNSYYTLAHNTRGPINNKQIRYADVLLAQAEAEAGLGNNAVAIQYLNDVRNRVNMPTYPGYDISINGTTITPSLEEAIRHERRVELAMEGHRWFDLCRWGVAKEVMDAYKATETDEAQNHMSTFVEGKHELFPIPSKERELNPLLTQNNGYN